MLMLILAVLVVRTPVFLGWLAVLVFLWWIACKISET